VTVVSVGQRNARYQAGQNAESASCTEDHGSRKQSETNDLYSAVINTEVDRFGNLFTYSPVYPRYYRKVCIYARIYRYMEG
jgi:hypothetical protein